MARKDLFKEKPLPEEELILPEKDFSPPSKRKALSDGFFKITKLVLGVCLLPYVYSVSIAFGNEFSGLEKIYQSRFWQGMVSLLVFYHFIWEPGILYSRGQKILEWFFSYLRPLVKTAPYLLPIYTLLAAGIYGLVVFAGQGAQWVDYYVFILGFTMALHLVFSAKSLRSKKADFLKGNYIFGFSFVYIVNTGILAFILNLAFERFSFVNFSNSFFQIARDIFSAGFKQLFL